MPLPKWKERFTYDDYCTWPDDERWEIIDGVAYDMSPAPIPVHQRIVLNLAGMIREILKGKTCVPFISPIDVVLSEYDVVQPDIVVVCDPNKVTEKNIQGAPDLVVEVLSPSTTKKDRREKRNLYEKHGVKEYLLIDPDGLYVERYLLQENGRYAIGEIIDAQEKLAFQSLPGVEVELKEVFEIEAPAEE
ncbi:MAG: Uma2 family endonuclease [Candidatus Omnitrophota bacterium]|jgi:Uma2 family endonuclease|nr:MAG: Uma2 family endonuclease [Candidatus Omnitrophota bacterium]